MKKMRIAIDSDFAIFQATEGKFTRQGAFSNEGGEVKGKSYKEPLKPYKKKFKQIIKEIEDEVSVEFLGEYKIKGKARVLLSDPKGNFRYGLDADYKTNRKASTRSELFYRLRDWAMKKYGYVKNVEADDVAGYLGRTGKYIICSFDKDVLKSVAGVHFDVYHTRRHKVVTGELEAKNFTLLQTLMGDPVDSIKGIPGVGEKTAIKLLDKFGWDDKGMLLAYESKGLGEKEMTLNRRLVGLDQWTPKKGLELWQMK